MIAPPAIKLSAPAFPPSHPVPVRPDQPVHAFSGWIERNRGKRLQAAERHAAGGKRRSAIVLKTHLSPPYPLSRVPRQYICSLKGDWIFSARIHRLVFKPTSIFRGLMITFGRGLGSGEEEVTVFGLGGLVHDLGK